MDKLKAILFDIDDTLFNRARAQRKWAYLMMQEFREVFKGIERKIIVDALLKSDRIGTEEFNRTHSRDAARIGRFKIFLKLLGLRDASAEKITALYVESYPKINAPMKGARSVIKSPVNRFQLGVVSNGFRDVQYQKLKALGIKDLFNCIVLSSEVGIWKPDPRIFWRATSLLERQPGECMYVGDSYDGDVLGAKKAGMQTCWFNTSGASLFQKGYKPNYAIQNLAEILKITTSERLVWFKQISHPHPKNQIDKC